MYIARQQIKNIRNSYFYSLTRELETKVQYSYIIINHNITERTRHIIRVNFKLNIFIAFNKVALNVFVIMRSTILLNEKINSFLYKNLTYFIKWGNGIIIINNIEKATQVIFVSTDYYPIVTMLRWLRSWSNRVNKCCIIYSVSFIYTTCKLKFQSGCQRLAQIGGQKYRVA